MTPTSPASNTTRWILPAVVVVLSFTTILGWMTLSAERTRSEDLAAKNLALAGSLTRVQAQLDTVTQRLASLNETVKTLQTPPPPEPVAAAEPAPAPKAVRASSNLRKVSAAKPKPTRQTLDPRFDQLQTRLAGQEHRLAGQEKEIASTKDQLAQARQDLEGRLGATRDELSTSIARTHEEVLELQRRGERNIYEFDIYKNKEFSRVGPLGLSLRKADVKRRSYQLKFRIDDQELEKKNVNLFEPIMISSGGASQPLQLVVNEITKDRVRGYISEPKLKQPALARSNSQQVPTLQTRQ